MQRTAAFFITWSPLSFRFLPWWKIRTWNINSFFSPYFTSQPVTIPLHEQKIFNPSAEPGSLNSTREPSYKFDYYSGILSEIDDNRSAGEVPQGPIWGQLWNSVLEMIFGDGFIEDSQVAQALGRDSRGI
jgi:hypothetical protein